MPLGRDSRAFTFLLRIFLLSTPGHLDSERHYRNLLGGHHRLHQNCSPPVLCHPRGIHPLHRPGPLHGSFNQIHPPQLSQEDFRSGILLGVLSIAIPGEITVFSNVSKLRKVKLKHSRKASPVPV